jgi:hypothetical protein
MAITIEELQAQLASERAASAAKSEELAKNKAENDALKTQLATTDIVKVAGEIELETSLEGKKSKKTYTIADGARQMWTKENNKVPTEIVVKLAKGEDITAETVKQYPHLGELVDPSTMKDNGEALRLLTDAAQRGAAFLVAK